MLLVLVNAIAAVAVKLLSGDVDQTGLTLKSVIHVAVAYTTLN